MPKVSVCCITYNHEKFLRQAIDSALMQQTKFEVEIVIGEDCSTDSTRDIVLDYQQRFPGRVKALLPKANLGIMGNLMATLAACTGDYIALLEGDDYWTDPQKLAVQLATLEAHPECALCIHDAEMFSDEVIVFANQEQMTSRLYSEQFPQMMSAARPVISQEEIIQLGWGIPTASMFFRRSALQMPQWFSGVYSGDYTLQLLITQHGSIYYVPRVMSRYRVHTGSITMMAVHSLSMINKRIFELQHYRSLLPQASERYSTDLEYWYFVRSVKFRQNGQPLQGWLDYLRAVTVSSARLKKHVKRLFIR
ncbi:glycosyltransferase [Hymenobacter fastidiosus]|uniref:Glycosyltransferase n=1 Tax=Hymenobacter fastidiosus TaxID=486264 RepID=A0ABP7T268_9BACT